MRLFVGPKWPLLLCLLGVPGMNVAAQTPAHRNADAAPRYLTIAAGSGKFVHMLGAATNLFVADPKVAAVRPGSPSTLFVMGLAPGRTTAAAMDADGRVVAQVEITVLPASLSAGGEGVTVVPGGNGMEVTGSVTSPEQAEMAVAMAKQAAAPGQTVDNRLSLSAPVQVTLRVRIAEMSRSLTRELGINWSGVAQLGKDVQFGVATANTLADLTNPASMISAAYHHGASDLNAVIDALSQDQLVHVLAEPNLTAMSGEPASFLVGGEFPIPVASNNNQITVDFKQYGISLAFVPTVVADGRISLHVRPEVSQLTTQGAVRLAEGNSSLQIPALTVRRADTTVELGSGQSFAIAGLMSDSTTLTGLGLPGLGDVPVLGALFRSDSFQRNETELVIVVTPYIVRPVSDPASLHLPTDGWTPPNDIERMLLLRQSGRVPPHIPGDAGWVVP